MVQLEPSIRPCARSHQRVTYSTSDELPSVQVGARNNISRNPTNKDLARVSVDFLLWRSDQLGPLPIVTIITELSLESRLNEGALIGLPP